MTENSVFPAKRVYLGLDEQQKREFMKIAIDHTERHKTVIYAWLRGANKPSAAEKGVIVFAMNHAGDFFPPLTRSDLFND